jgi:large subunit ribosomal protein L3
MAMLLGKKVGITQVFDEQGRLLPVTVIQAGPCSVMQVKTVKSDGYSAVQMGFDDVRPSRAKKPQIGHSAKANIVPKRFIREMRLNEDTQCEYKPGDTVTVSVFSQSKRVDVTGTSKGKGYAGVMKRHGFGGMPGSHGTERMHRHSGSIASHGSDRGHGGNLKKGKRMAGRMGHEKVTTKNHSVVSIDEDKNLIVIKGSVPGPAGGYVVVRTSQKG